MKNDFFSRYTLFLEKRGKLLMVFLAILMIFSIVGFTRLGIVTDFKVFMPDHSRYIKNIEEMNEVFGGSEQLVYLLHLQDPVNSIETVNTLLDLTENLARIEGVVFVGGPIPAKIFIAGKTVNTRDVSPDQLNEIFNFLSALMDGGGIIKKDENHYASFQIILDGIISNREVVKKVNTIFETYGEDYVISGEPYLEAMIFDYILRLLLTLPPFALFLMLTVFRWRIGSFRATALSMFPAAIGAAITVGGIGWTLGNITFITALVPIFVIVMGSADGLHFTSHVIDGLAMGREKKEVVGETLRAVGNPMIMTTLTTMVGFLSMLFIKSQAIRTMGIAASFGILAAGIVTWVFLPVLLLHVPGLESSKRKETDGIYHFISRIKNIRAYILAVLLILVFIPGIGLIRANFNMLSIYKKSTEVHKSVNAVNSILGGSLPIGVMYSSEGDLLAPEVADKILLMQEELRVSNISETSVSIYTLISRAKTLFNEDQEPGYPENPMVARLMATMLSRQNPRLIETFLKKEENKGRVVFYLKDLEKETLVEFERIIEKYDEDLDLTIAGIPYVMKDMNDQIIPQQINSLLVALALVFLLMVLTQKSLRLAIFSIAPIMVTLLTLFGTMGYARIDLSISTGIMSGLTIGVGIDYAIHFSSLYRYFHKKGHPDPVTQSLKYVSSPVLANALGLGIGFTAMLLSPMTVHTFLVILMWVTMICSALLSLTLLPSLVLHYRKKKQ
jgi:predicted RND superfamily exporter protein